MPRRGRSASPPPAQRRAAPRAAPAPAQSNLPARTAAAPPATVPTAAPMAAPQQPSMFQQMAATAGGVAVGSAVGHTIGAGLTGLFSGGGDKEVAQAPAQAAQPAAQYNGSHPQDPQGPCAWEIKQFIECAQGQSDLTLCQGFNEAVRQCKAQHHIN